MEFKILKFAYYMDSKAILEFIIDLIIFLFL